MKTPTIVIAILAIVALPAFAEPAAAPAAGPPVADGAKPGPGPGGIPDEDLRDLVSTIMMVRISRTLELTDEQTVVMVKHMQDMRDEMGSLYNERDNIVKSLRDLVATDGAPDSDIDAKLKELMAIDEKRLDAKKTAFDKISSGLTAKQKAKLYVTLQDFEGQMRKMMARAKEVGEDVVREKLQQWERGEGPRGPMDRPAVRQFMKNRRGGPTAPDAAPETAPPAETKAP